MCALFSLCVLFVLIVCCCCVVVFAVVFAKVDANKNGKVDASEVATLVLIMIEGADFSKLTSA